MLKDLCARLPYELKANVTFFNKNRLCVITGVSLNRDTGLYSIEIRKPNRELQHVQWPTNIIKPYLRPIHKLTKEELEELEFLTDSDYVDYCNKHHIDYRNLIPKGLALEAPEGMYNLKDE